MPTGDKDTSGASGDAAAIKEQAAGNPKVSDSEFGGPKGLEPTRYGDWERNGRCIDF